MYFSFGLVIGRISTLKKVDISESQWMMISFGHCSWTKTIAQPNVSPRNWMAICCILTQLLWLTNIPHLTGRNGGLPEHLTKSKYVFLKSLIVEICWDWSKHICIYKWDGELVFLSLVSSNLSGASKGFPHASPILRQCQLAIIKLSCCCNMHAVNNRFCFLGLIMWCFPF